MMSKFVSQPAKQATRLTFEPNIHVSLFSKELLRNSSLNKGSAFTHKERRMFDLESLLPEVVNTLESQVERARQQFLSLKAPLERNQFMHSMKRQNKTLYFALVQRYLKEMMGIIYTPTQGEAIENYSHLFREPEGCFLNIHDPDRISHHLSHWGASEDIDYIVVTDSEGILGIGDQGVGGVGISVAKLALMTACGGVSPDRVIPVVLDTGTDNQELLNDPLYMGNRHPRIRGEEYDEFIDKFMKVVKSQFPDSVLHLEDFGTANGYNILHRYKDKLAVWDDDIQGTGAVTMATLKGGLGSVNRKIQDATILIYGAGSAGMGIADQVVDNLVTSEGISEEKATEKIYLMDRDGLLLKGMSLRSGQVPYAKNRDDLSALNTKSLYEVVKELKPDVLVGCSTQAGAFTEEIVKEMASHVKRPVILPLSNPTRLHEATPANLIEWTDGRVLVATGSPFEPVNGREISENNNCFIFPGVGFGAVVSRATSISKRMLAAAVDELAALSPVRNDPEGSLLPDVKDIQEISARVASAVAYEAKCEGIAQITERDSVYNDEPIEIPEDYEERLKWVKSQMWRPVYRRYIKSARFI